MIQTKGNNPIKYCPRCGGGIEWKVSEHKQRLFCPSCQKIHYPQLKVGAGGIIEHNKSLLLLQRTQAPFEQSWNLPAGYAEIDENPLQTVVREVQEETGLCISVERLIDVYFFDDDPRGNGILIVYKCHSIGGELTDTVEGVNPAFFPLGDIPGNLAGGGHDQAITAWQKSR